MNKMERKRMMRQLPPQIKRQENWHPEDGRWVFGFNRLDVAASQFQDELWAALVSGARLANWEETRMPPFPSRQRVQELRDMPREEMLRACLPWSPFPAEAIPLVPALLRWSSVAVDQFVAQRTR